MEVIDRTWKEREYPSRSEFVRDALRDATEPLLSENALCEIASGFEDVRVIVDRERSVLCVVAIVERKHDYQELAGPGEVCETWREKR